MDFRYAYYKISLSVYMISTDNEINICTLKISYLTLKRKEKYKI